jgi:hypothetical protein
MPLADLDLPVSAEPLPPDVRRFLKDADRRIEDFLYSARVPAFVPSDYPTAFRMLRALSETPVARGNRFCEWGSGYGVVTCLAAMLGFEAVGIEIDPGLVDCARRLAEDYGLDAEFVAGSFVPRGAEERVYRAGEYAWLTTESDDAYDELGLDPADMDVVFAYPWPDEEAVTDQLFDRYAAAGAVLVTHHSGDVYRARRRLAGKKRKQ